MTDRERIPYLMFAPSESPRVSGSTGCNRFKGGTTMAGGSILFGGIVATKMACAGAPDIEREFLDALDKARSWRIRDNHFELSGSDGRSVARFVAVR
ncbi:MAG: META domain-containing protein [Pseudazoarcus pumilus]|nr:META domain-containing protein [Pseudazoarcus pumilus]